MKGDIKKLYELSISFSNENNIDDLLMIQE